MVYLKSTVVRVQTPGRRDVVGHYSAKATHGLSGSRSVYRAATDTVKVDPKTVTAVEKAIVGYVVGLLRDASLTNLVQEYLNRLKNMEAAKVVDWVAKPHQDLLRSFIGEPSDDNAGRVQFSGILLTPDRLELPLRRMVSSNIAELEQAAFKAERDSLTGNQTALDLFKASTPVRSIMSAGIKFALIYQQIAEAAIKAGKTKGDDLGVFAIEQFHGVFKKVAAQQFIPWLGLGLLSRVIVLQPRLYQGVGGGMLPNDPLIIPVDFSKSPVVIQSPAEAFLLDSANHPYFSYIDLIVQFTKLVRAKFEMAVPQFMH